MKNTTIKLKNLINNCNSRNYMKSNFMIGSGIYKKSVIFNCHNSNRLRSITIICKKNMYNFCNLEYNNQRNVLIEC